MTIEIDDTAWGLPVGGIWLGFYRVESGEMVVREVGVKYFQGNAFETKVYLEECVQQAKIGIFRDLKRKNNEMIHICSGYVLSSIRKWLEQKGFQYRQKKITGTLQREMEKVSQSYIDNLPHFHKKKSESLYDALLCWIKESPKKRLKYAKTGWKPIKKIVNGQ
jgi:hypothetical protein